MGQKVNPFIFRVILNRNWNSVWFSKNKFFSKNLIEDINIRKIISNYLYKFIYGKIIIQKSSRLINIIIYVENKNFLFSSFNIIKLKNNLFNLTKKNIYINFFNIEKPSFDLNLIFNKLKEKILFRKSYKVLINNIFYDFFISGGIGMKILIKGRINGSVMSKKQLFKQGKLPLQRISSDIRYFSGFVKTIYGIIGIKLWCYIGDLIYI
ncbi:30S ribosomal protein S3p (S3e) [Candidatus Nasuia deltocephalinicola]|nr:30S ribosomal protein S3p (S3e) [Candidatus Nasuia deltocephalinicola]